MGYSMPKPSTIQHGGARVVIANMLKCNIAVSKFNPSHAMNPKIPSARD